ncbi:helix-turn-helix domain-containing protein [Paenibacillus sp. MER 99-2]|uniref:winged helix-turn-helix transcriptional regulator n=1 Tax=Paenibacillus sp. MER 99-2 TaxID=2939572 RepID=UPI00203DD2A4|nr:helix-turn-helix domain-containing protein [Paenibacillus sp. MER 99-2]MCM3171936.1 helix-turn-helix transcriptional regulator [Paenibacillus sp. MER 99-2]
MKQHVNASDDRCPVEASINLIGGKWKILILYHLISDTSKRFNELQKTLSTITHRTLTRQLRELEEDRLIRRIIHPEVPPKVEYMLTDTGKSLVPILMQLQNWGTNYLQNSDVDKA